MNIVFTEDDGTEIRWDRFRPGRMMSPESEAIEKVTGMTFTEWGQALMNGSAVAGRALVWVLKKRQQPDLRFRNVSYAMEQLSISFDEDELSKLRARLDDDSLTDDDRSQIEAVLSAHALEDLDFDPPSPTPVESETG